MANVLVQESSLSAIASAIRTKNGTATTYKPGQMAAAVLAIDVNRPVVIDSADHSERFAVYIDNGRLSFISCGTKLDVTDMFLADASTGDKYSMCVENGKAELVVAETDNNTITPQLFDVVTGVAYLLTAASGKIVLQEV